MNVSSTDITRWSVEALITIQNSLTLEESTFVWFMWYKLEQKNFKPTLEQTRKVDSLWGDYEHEIDAEHDHRFAVRCEELNAIEAKEKENE